MSLLEMQDVSKGFGHGTLRTEVLRDIQLSVEEGEFVAIVGYSGTGKSTLVSLLAGLQTPDSGRIHMRGQAIHRPGPDRGVVFQNYSLLPWLTVRENILFAIEQVYPQWSRQQQWAHCERYVELVQLSHAIDKVPRELSGGMRQRVSLARTLATQPNILLLDEPLSALDALTRVQLQTEIVGIWERDRRTVLLITNDVEEAVLMADRVIALIPSENQGATLSQSWHIPLERPRIREKIVSHPTFKEIKRNIVQCLTSARRRMLESEAEGNASPLAIATLNGGAA